MTWFSQTDAPKLKRLFRHGFQTIIIALPLDLVSSPKFVQALLEFRRSHPGSGLSST